uniref:Uncharacterized protein n=1 Tax=Anser cygnoides TaxID=8845 RepID=A0A8B9EHS1_ANSCY
SGFTWKDDYTQHVIGQELSNIHKIHNRHPDIFVSEASDTGSYEAILTQAFLSTFYSLQSYIYNDPIRYYMMQKPKEREPPLAHTSTSHQQYAENPRGRTFNQLQPDKFSSEPELGLDQKTLMAALHTYITQNLSAQSNDKSSHSRTKGSHIYADRFYSSPVSPFDGTFAKGKAEDFKMKKPFQTKPASGVLGPTSEKLNHKSNTSKLANLLKENAVPENMPKDVIPEESTKSETKKSEDTDSSSEEINVGVENVKSETFSRELTAEKSTESDSKDPSETRYWIKNALMQDGNSYEQPQKNAGQGLQLEVKSTEEKEYGYIVTLINGIEGNRIVEDSCFGHTVLL